MLRKKQPLISVIVPVFNGERYLAEALESIQYQTYPHVEVIVVNDGSMDGSESVIKDFPSVISINQVHSGLSAALNNGIKNASGDFFAFLDADDIWMKDKLWNQMKTLMQNPEVDAVFGHIVQFITLNKTHRFKEKDLTNKIPGYCKGSMLIRKRSFFRIGFFDTRWKIGDFIDWYKRAKEKNLITLLMPEVVMKRRVHNENMSSNRDKEEKDYIRILKAAMDRSRKKDA
jgi:glycosyltransferase involved in cell wall biosynthesis